MGGGSLTLTLFLTDSHAEELLQKKGLERSSNGEFDLMKSLSEAGAEVRIAD